VERDICPTAAVCAVLLSMSTRGQNCTRQEAERARDAYRRVAETCIAWPLLAYGDAHTR